MEDIKVIVFFIPKRPPGFEDKTFFFGVERNVALRIEFKS